jgi:hypothetical protein
VIAASAARIDAGGAARCAKRSSIKGHLSAICT